jgi:hypothetical protein
MPPKKQYGFSRRDLVGGWKHGPGRAQARTIAGRPLRRKSRALGGRASERGRELMRYAGSPYGIEPEQKPKPESPITPRPPAPPAPKPQPKPKPRPRPKPAPRSRPRPQPKPAPPKQGAVKMINGVRHVYSGGRWVAQRASSPAPRPAPRPAPKPKPKKRPPGGAPMRRR